MACPTNPIHINSELKAKVAELTQELATLQNANFSLNDQMVSTTQKASVMETALRKCSEAIKAMDISNDTLNPFSKTFVRPWPELYKAGESAEKALSDQGGNNGA